jgi:hypothetical protein
MSSTGLDSVRTAVIVVHGVGDTERGASMAQLAESYGNAAQHRVLENRDRTLRVERLPGPSELRGPLAFHAPYLERAKFDAYALPVAVRRVVQDGASPIEFMECHWADLSRTGSWLDVVRDLGTIVVALPDLGRRVLEWAFSPTLRARRRSLAWAHGTQSVVSWLLGVAAPILFLTLLVAALPLPLLGLAEHHPHQCKWALAGLGGFAAALAGALLTRSVALDARKAAWQRVTILLLRLMFVSASAWLVGRAAWHAPPMLRIGLLPACAQAVAFVLAWSLLVRPIERAREPARRGSPSQVLACGAGLVVALYLGYLGWAVLGAGEPTGGAARHVAAVVFHARLHLAVVMTLAALLVAIWTVKIVGQVALVLSVLAALGPSDAARRVRRALALAMATTAIGSWLYLAVSMLTAGLLLAATSELLGLEVAPLAIPGLHPEELAGAPVFRHLEMTLFLSATPRLREAAAITGLAIVWVLVLLGPLFLAELGGAAEPLTRGLVGRTLGDPTPGAPSLAERQKLALERGFEGLWWPLAALVLATTVVNAWGIVEVLADFGGALHGDDFDDFQTRQIRWMLAVSTFLLGSGGIFALRGVLRDRLPALGPILDAALDVERYVRPPAETNLRAAVFARLHALVEHAFDGGATAVVIAAHSQGTVIAADYLRLRAAMPHARRTASLGLLTFGSPLGHLYAYAFADPYRWARNPQLRRMSVSRWVNAFHAGDYIGQRIAGVGAAVPEEVSLGEGGHTGYFADARLVRQLEKLIEHLRRPAAS